jgi:hypothetical protein
MTKKLKQKKGVSLSEVILIISVIFAAMTFVVGLIALIVNITLR